MESFFMMNKLGCKGTHNLGNGERGGENCADGCEIPLLRRACNGMVGQPNQY